MKIKKIYWQNRNDFCAILVCEWCGHEADLKSGYDDSTYHNKVLPSLICGSCFKNGLYQEPFLKFRAIIPWKNSLNEDQIETCYFTLRDLSESDSQSTPFRMARDFIKPWILKGNIPDQYIGLRDKNGNEIYKGDILKNPLYDSLGPVIEVKHESGCFTPFNRDWVSSDDFEIIGNIHKNPELIVGESEIIRKNK